MKSTSNPPKTIRVLGKKLKVVVESPELHTTLAGTHAGFTGTIAIHGGLSHGNARQTFLHELVHEIEEAGAIEMSEQDVQSFSSILYAIIRDNPKLMVWLQEKE